jgi:erythrocyte band 7 integral membrane protein
MHIKHIQIVKEYERAVIMRLGRISSGQAKGPGLFFILPCIDSITVIDLRTVTFDVPPQEVNTVVRKSGKFFENLIFFT